MIDPDVDVDKLVDESARTQAVWWWSAVIFAIGIWSVIDGVKGDAGAVWGAWMLGILFAATFAGNCYGAWKRNRRAEAIKAALRGVGR